MPPMIRFTREAVLSAASRIVRREGHAALNARAVARELGGSTQPIFRLFTGMEELHSAVRQQSIDAFFTVMRADMAASPTPFLAMCLYYLHYAQQEPELFRLLFMCDRVSDGSYEREQSDYAALFQLMADSMGITVAQAEALYSRVWVFTHGLAVAIVTKYIPPMDDQALTDRVSEACDATMNKLGITLA